MDTNEISAIFDDLELLVQNAVEQHNRQQNKISQCFEMEREIRRLKTENSMLSDKNTRLQENQKNWQNRLRGILEKMDDN